MTRMSTSRRPLTPESDRLWSDFQTRAAYELFHGDKTRWRAVKRLVAITSRRHPRDEDAAVDYLGGELAVRYIKIYQEGNAPYAPNTIDWEEVACAVREEFP